jgi:WD40 repeat protein
VALSSDDEILASGSKDKTIKIWDIGNATVLLTLHGHTDYVMSVVLTPDNRTLISGSRDRTVRIWDTQTGVQSGSLEGHQGAV